MMKEESHRADASIEGAAIVDAIKRSGVEFVVSVPDRVTSETVLRRVASDSALKLVRVCKEDEGVSICAALSFCDKRALLLMQNTGLLEISELDALKAELPGILRATGPVLIDLKVEPGASYPQDFNYMHSAAARDKFKAALHQPGSVCGSRSRTTVTRR